MSFIPLSKADLDILEKEKREIERRRRDEAQRKTYFFDDKKRSMGVDAAFIQKQIDEKAQARKDEVAEDRTYRSKVESFVDKLAVLDGDRNEYYKQRTHAVGQHQKNSSVKNCDTFDLNDPDKVKKDAPPRTHDDQTVPSCALQKFDGEDLEIDSRVKRQQKELRGWCSDIIEEKSQNKQDAQAAIARYVDDRTAHLQHLSDVESNHQQQRKHHSIVCSQVNLDQKAEKQNREEADRQHQASESKQEVANMMASEFLNETWESTTRADNDKRFIPYNFKGLSQSQKQAILDKQASQIQDNVQRSQNQKAQDEAYYQEQQEYSRKALLQMRNAQRLKQERNTDLFKTHENQIVETQQKTEHQNSVYANKVTPGYFAQFGTSTR